MAVRERASQTNARSAKVGSGFASDRALILLKERMISSPNRLHFGGSGAGRTQSQMWSGRLLRACLVALAFAAAATATRPAQAQANFDRPGGDYQSSPVASGDPADCALVCERDRRCRAWSFNYPTDIAGGAVCWLKSNVPARTQDNCCISGVRGAGVVEPRNGGTETSLDRFGDDECKAACTADNKCRAWTYARPGYAGKAAHCFLKKDIKPPRRKAGFISGVVR